MEIQIREMAVEMQKRREKRNKRKKNWLIF